MASLFRQSGQAENDFFRNPEFVLMPSCVIQPGSAVYDRFRLFEKPGDWLQQENVSVHVNLGRDLNSATCRRHKGH